MIRRRLETPTEAVLVVGHGADHADYEPSSAHGVDATSRAEIGMLEE